MCRAPAPPTRNGADVIYGLVQRGLLRQRCFDKQCMAAFRALPPQGQLAAADELAGMLPRQLRNPSSYFTVIIRRIDDRLTAQGELHPPCCVSNVACSLAMVHACRSTTTQSATVVSGSAWLYPCMTQSSAGKRMTDAV